MVVMKGIQLVEPKVGRLVERWVGDLVLWKVVMTVGY
jgi:hypothetical protein